ncbi:hypothetical protein FXO38_20517 [Capsicum annuum]|uniref:F-box domain-containing protein n=1 Tax=Capsicum annuum TaxID=4072 RepID=A0A2G2ZWG1_CAPAN|nr:hypothetical protein FXO37_28041 [Capsicum annuum]KAF3643703.1 hypothetical protein FXO38_20517 [Capsicum annuum]PHT86314.1 hypothetical protein T459_08420 [Capsicum annuum]
MRENDSGLNLLKITRKVRWNFPKELGGNCRSETESRLASFAEKSEYKIRLFKVWLHKNKKNSRSAPADILPGCLIQYILGYLSFKEATKMSVVSKTWFQAWLTLPNLEFKVGYPKGKAKIVDNIMEKYRKGKIPI